MDTIINAFSLPGEVRLRVTYQDVTTQNGIPVGREALARFPSSHCLEDALNAIRFCRQMHSLTIAVVTRVCREIARLSDGIPINVNIPIDCLTMEAFNTIHELLDHFAIPDRSFALELLEYPAFSWTKETLRVANAFKGINVPIYLDDFRDTPWQWRVIQGFLFDAIKIDRSLIGNRLRLSKTLSLLADTGVETFIIEGIETREDLDRVLKATQELENYATVHLQGFFFSNPDVPSLPLIH